MMKVLLLSIILFLAGCENKKDTNQFYMPGQFEEQDAVWLGWQGYDPYFPVGADMIEALLPFAKRN